MKKIDLLYGVLIGIIAAFIGVYLFIAFFTDYDFLGGFSILRREGKLGKVITLGAILNLVVFFILFRKRNIVIISIIVWNRYKFFL